MLVFWDILLNSDHLIILIWILWLIELNNILVTIGNLNLDSVDLFKDHFVVLGSFLPWC